ncbi:MAG TPA: MFS transporter, partial [Armatimonadetes bacterium]|nr:MFS transporter [Armatimonadota bacterium]
FWCALALIMDFAGGVLSVAIPLLAVELGANDAMVGLIGAMAPLGYMAFTLLNPRVSKHIGKERSALVGTLCYTVVVLLLPFAQRPLHLVIPSALTGIALGFYWPPVQALMGASVEQRRLLTFITIYNVSWSFGRTMGTRMAGTLFTLHQSLPFITSSVVGACLAVVLGGTLLRKANRSESVFATDVNELTSVTFTPYTVVSAQLGNLLRTLTVGVVIALFPKWAADMNMNPERVSQLLFLVLAGHVVSFMIAPLLYQWIRPTMLLGIKTAIIIAGAGIAFSQTALHFAFWFLILGFSAGLACTTSTYFSILSQGQTTRGSARHEATVGAGFVFGPLLGGLVAQLVGSPRAPYMMTGAFGAILVLLDSFKFLQVGAHHRHH